MQGQGYDLESHQSPRFDLALITPPVSEPVSPIEAHRHLRVTNFQEDEYIVDLIEAARTHVEQSLLLGCLLTQTWEVYYDYFPVWELDIPRPPLQSVVSIEYQDVRGVTQIMSPADYRVITKKKPGAVVPVYGEQWPYCTRYESRAVTIKFVAGYGDDPEDVPQPIKRAILLIVGMLYRDREGSTEMRLSSLERSMSMGVRSLLGPYAMRPV